MREKYQKKSKNVHIHIPAACWGLGGEPTEPRTEEKNKCSFVVN